MESSRAGTLYIPIILGTARQGRQSEHVANFLLSEMKKRPEIETEVIDVRQLKMRLDDAGEENSTSAHQRVAVLFVSFCRTFATNGNLGGHEAGFREAVKFLLPVRDNLNAVLYLFENAERASAPKVRESLLAFSYPR
jgi:hypothetical protein